MLLSSVGYGADWKLYKTDVIEGSFYYDPQSIKQASKDIEQVRSKQVYTEKKVQEYIKAVGPAFKELSYCIGLFEYNCSEKKFRLFSATLYKKNGNVLLNTPPQPWILVVPETVSETLFKIVCGSR